MFKNIFRTLNLLCTNLVLLIYLNFIQPPPPTFGGQMTFYLIFRTFLLLWYTFNENIGKQNMPPKTWNWHKFACKFQYSVRVGALGPKAPANSEKFRFILWPFHSLTHPPPPPLSHSKLLYGVPDSSSTSILGYHFSHIFTILGQKDNTFLRPVIKT